jgi:hypothetical protein
MVIILKSVEITELNTTVEADDLIINAKFKLAPSKRIFSRIKADLHFDGKLVKSFYLGIPYYFTRYNEFPLKAILNLEEINPGSHTIELKMLGLWPYAGPSDCKEAIFEYQPLATAIKVREIPKIKKIEGPDIAVLTSESKKLYEEMKERWKKEVISRRERW